MKTLKYKKSKWVGCLIAGIVTGLMLQIGLSPVQAELKSPRIAPPGATAFGKTLANWLGTYWRWYYSGADPDQNQVGSVRLLALPAGDFISGSGTPNDPTLLRGHLNITLKP